jgi:alpha-beta hydrolase superfamily lysophospholipase
MASSALNNLYLLPGRNGRLDKGLGAYLIDIGHQPRGRDQDGDFAALRFRQKIDVVVEDLLNGFLHPEARLIGSSFGAYILLHAMLELPPLPGKVLLLSPIIGSQTGPDGMTFIPPRANVLIEASEDQRLPKPAWMEIHVGELDRQSDPVLVKAFAEPLGIPYHIHPDQGHTLDKQLVAGIIDSFLSSDDRASENR